MRADLGWVGPLHGGAGELARLEVLAAGLRHVRAQVAVAGQLAAPRPVTRHLNGIFRHEIFSRNIFQKYFIPVMTARMRQQRRCIPSCLRSSRVQTDGSLVSLLKLSSNTAEIKK